MAEWQPIDLLKAGRWVFLGKAGDERVLLGKKLSKIMQRQTGYLFDAPATSFNGVWDDWYPTHWQHLPKRLTRKRKFVTREERRAAWKARPPLAYPQAP